MTHFIVIWILCTTTVHNNGHLTYDSTLWDGTESQTIIDRSIRVRDFSTLKDAQDYIAGTPANCKSKMKIVELEELVP